MKLPRLLNPFLLALPALFLSCRLAAGPIAVFGEKDLYPLDAVPASDGPTAAGQHAFFQAYKEDQARQPSYETVLDLINPPAWGKTVSAATHGKIQFHPSFAGGLVCRIALEGLLPDHNYILTLNGNPSLPGNELFLSAVPGNGTERYYDFIIVKTDASGHFDEGFGIYLKSGKYAARCYVKDTSDFKIVLYHDYFPFEVK
jgi:hypothetical protein